MSCARRPDDTPLGRGAPNGAWLHLGALVLCAFLGWPAALFGCAGESPRTSERSVLLDGRKDLVLLLPLNVATVMQTEVEVLRPVVWDELETFLRAHDKDLKTVAHNAARRLWIESIRQARASELGVRAGHDDAARILALELGKHADFDALVIPSLFVRKAAVSNRIAHWDGVERKLTFDVRGIDAATLAATPLESVAPGASLHIAVFDAAGQKLHEGVGGLDVLARVRVSGNNLSGVPTFQFVPRDDSMENVDHVREGISAAFAPFLGSRPD